MMSLGISLFYPQTFLVQHTGPRECCIYVTDRSSGSRIILVAAPSHPAFAGQWHQLRRSSPITAAGPLPIFTGFSIKPLGASCNVWLQYVKSRINVKKNLSGVSLELITDSRYPCPWRCWITIAIVIVLIKYIFHSAKKTQHLKAVFGS